MSNTLSLNIIITGTIVIGAYFLFRLLLKISRKPILKISLSQVEYPKWSDPDRVTKLIHTFKKNGFDLVGHYSCVEMPSLIISGFVKPSEQVSGVIYDHPGAGIWTDVFVQYKDGGSLTVSNAPIGDELDQLPQHIKIYSRESDVDELIVKLLREIRKAGRITITKEEFASNFEDQYRKEMKWRMERGGPTPLEIKRVAISMGRSMDTEKMQSVTQRIRNDWFQEKNRTRQDENLQGKAVFSSEFEQTTLFRQRMEKASMPAPRLNLPAIPVYVVFVSLLASWFYYGYRYNETHFPVSWTALIIFLLVLTVLFLLMMVFREYHRRVRMYPVLKRMADNRPGAFLVIVGNLPTLFYAQENWIGKVSFEEGDDSKNAFTRLEAVTRNTTGWLSISRKGFLSQAFGWSDKDRIQLPDSDFSRKFEVLSRDRMFAERMLDSSIPSIMTRIGAWKEPFLEIERNSVVIRVGTDLSGTRKETELRQFLDAAESIVEIVARQSG